MNANSFRKRVRGRKRLVGTFLKTAAYQVVEVLGTTELDVFIIDAEHAPFDRGALDACMLAARAVNLPMLVRIPNSAPDTILGMLDIGASGLLVPHARSEQGVREMVSASRYLQGSRGFSNSSRAGRYGRCGMADLIERADRETTTIWQIEDREAVDNIERLVGIEEVDCLFIGRADLAVSYGLADITHRLIDDAVLRTCVTCQRAQKPIGMFLGSVRDCLRYEELGVSLFVIGSDQSMLQPQSTIMTTAPLKATQSTPSCI
jgi:2-keto-3-deoxy-L-rhamnonate aldolase RhmA